MHKVGKILKIVGNNSCVFSGLKDKYVPAGVSEGHDFYVETNFFDYRCGGCYEYLGKFLYSKFIGSFVTVHRAKFDNLLVNGNVMYGGKVNNDVFSGFEFMVREMKSWIVSITASYTVS